MQLLFVGGQRRENSRPGGPSFVQAPPTYQGPAPSGLTDGVDYDTEFVDGTGGID